MRGVTLVEVLVVLVLIAILTSAIVMGTGGVSSARLKGAASFIVSLSKIATTRANATGRPVRIVFDLEQNRIVLEEAVGSRLLRVREGEKSSGAGAQAATDAEKKAEAEAEGFLQGARAARPNFLPTKRVELGGQNMGTGRELESGIVYKQVQTEHDEKPRTEGRAYLYFWPGGATEWASIQLQVKGKKNTLTVLVSPLTGRSQIKSGSVELPKRNMDGEISEREESL
jgi:general secretion pathway protein H